MRCEILEPRTNGDDLDRVSIILSRKEVTLLSKRWGSLP